MIAHRRPARSLAVFLLALAAPAAADEPTKGPLLHPDGPGEGNVRLAAGALLDILPRQLVEAEQRHFPRVTAAARWGVPYGFALGMHGSSSYTQNDLFYDFTWSFRLGSLSFALESHVGLFYGTVQNGGHDATSWGLESQPGIAMGMRIAGSSRLTIGLREIVLLGQYVKLGDARVVTRHHRSFAGAALAFTVESYVGKSDLLYYGVTIFRTAPDYQAWQAFSDSEARYPYPRFEVGYAF